MGKFQAGPPVRATELTPEELSQLMDGELDAEGSEHAGETSREAASIETWACYHMIGETLRLESGRLIPGFTARFCPRLDTEPTVLAPRRRPSAATIAWAAAASVAAVGVVGWVALTTMAVPPAVVASAPQQVAAVRPAEVRRPVVDEYLLAHQEYSPTTAIQGVRPYLRAVATDTPDAPE